MDIYALWREISLDPVAMGYAGKTDAQVAALLNGKTRSTTRMSITGAELLDKTALAELKALDATSREAYWGLVGMGTLDITSANVKSIAGALFPAGSATRTALVALAAAPIMQSRAEALGLGVVEAVHVWQARREFGGT